MDNNGFENKSGIILCRECKRPLSLSVSSTNYDFSFICRCGVLHRERRGEVDGATSQPVTTVQKGNEYFCGSCGEKLFTVNPDSFVNFAFKLKCTCGRMCENRNSVKQRRRLIEI